MDHPIQSFFQIPPFPDAKVDRWPVRPALLDNSPDLDAWCAALVHHRVGGTFWGEQPRLPVGCAALLWPRDAGQARSMLALARARWPGQPLAMCALGGVVEDRVTSVSATADPWSLVGQVQAVCADRDSTITLVARLFGKPVYPDVMQPELECPPGTEMLAALLNGVQLCNPFTGEDVTVEAAIVQLGAWRQLIDANRGLSVALGFAFWKQQTVAPLLWGGAAPITYASDIDGLQSGASIAVWSARLPVGVEAAIDSRHLHRVEVEDGFIRSTGLGADCVPPLSIIVDSQGIYFDPGRPSDLEKLIATHVYSHPLLEQADALRTLIVESGISKYALGKKSLPRAGGDRRHVLVVGQVEDDRSVRFGGGDVKGNLDLIRRARALEPDAWLIYKPHPDVEAGHRKGRVTASEAMRYADAIVVDQPITGLIEMVDHVHVLTSLAGFEALLRDTPVTTHGMPFYAGWGLTKDLAPVPDRRSIQRTLSELVAATLLLYPRYLDPVSGLPCPAEILVHRLSAGQGPQNKFLVGVRKLQGRLFASMARLMDHAT